MKHEYSEYMDIVFIIPSSTVLPFVLNILVTIHSSIKPEQVYKGTVHKSTIQRP